MITPINQLLKEYEELLEKTIITEKYTTEQKIYKKVEIELIKKFISNLEVNYIFLEKEFLKQCNAKM